MMLLEGVDKRSQQHNLWLGGTTAAVAGFVNVCSVIAFFAFSSNVTGHVAIFAEETVKGHWHQVSVVVMWMTMFLFGAFLANLSVTFLGDRRPYVGRGAPLVLQLLLMAVVGYYGHHHYLETLKETEWLVAALVFCMGMQNGAVASVSNGVVKTTHLTGLFTDLGMEASMMLQRRYRDAAVRFKLKLHVLILVTYIVGGVIGGYLFIRLGFQSLYIASAGLLCILIHDVMLLLGQQSSWSRNEQAAASIASANGSSSGGASTAQTHEQEALEDASSEARSAPEARTESEAGRTKVTLAAPH